EVFAVADRVTVLRQGTVTLRGAVRDQTEAALAEAMIGTALHDASAEPRTERGVPRAEPRIARVSIGSVTIGAGELVGIAAIEGQGQRQILRHIATVAEPSGSERVKGSEVPVSVSGRVAFIPEDRATDGLIPQMSIAENLILARENDPRWTRGGWMRWSAVREHAGRLMGLFQIRAPSPNTPAGHLSGGNQQKLILGRALEGAPQILVAESPTRGLDIRATVDVQDRLRQAAREGVAVLMYSTDLDEVLSLADRVLVVREGRVTEAPPGADRHEVGWMMLGVEVIIEM
ncbi:MAG: ATP-binding cassette domain-containing protein, partial [Gemmatimonadales bacterium]